MNTYLHKQYLETKAQFIKLSSRLLKSQESGRFQKLPERKQNHLVSRIKKIWGKLRILEIRLKIVTVGASLAMLLIVSNVQAQGFQLAPEKNPLPLPTIFASQPLLVDIDKDGDLDLIASIDFENIDLYVNNGNPNIPDFQKVSDNENPFRDLPEEIFLRIPNIIDFGDIDGDGDIDFLLDSEYTVKNTGTNSNIEFTPEPAQNYYFYRCRLGDLDGDGDLDLISISDEGKVELYENTGNASSMSINQTPQLLDVVSWDQEIDYVHDMRLIDYDDDGDIDLLFRIESYSYDPVEGYQFYEKTGLIRNTGSVSNPVFRLLPDNENPYVDLIESWLAPGDLDDDGDIDIIRFSNNYGLQYYEMGVNTISENMDFIPQFSDGIVLPYSTFAAPRFVDFDADGDLDLFAYSYSDNNLLFYEYSETGKQLKYLQIEEKEFPFRDDTTDIQIPYFVDIDLDGDLDVVSLKYSYDNEIIYYELANNEGSTAEPDYTLTGLPDLVPQGYSYFPTFVDIDDDGDMDVFFIGVSYYADEYDLVQYFENTGNGSLEFTPRSGNQNPLDDMNVEKYLDKGIFKLVFADLDQDGDYDAVFNDYYGNIYYFENTGSSENPAFSDRSDNGYFNSIYANYYGQINLVDLDKDGDDDLFVHEYYGTITRYYENTGALSVSPDIKQTGMQLNIYPNPVLHELGINLKDISQGTVNFEVISLDSKELISGSFNIAGENGEHSINVSSLSSGIYYIKLFQGRRFCISKFIKQ